MKTGKQKIVVVMPTYNAEKTLLKTYKDIPKSLVDETILVDDKSYDKTVEIARKLNLKVSLHSQNLGYGGNQKICYKQTLKLKADIVVMVHPDYQYDAKLIPELVRPIIEDQFDIMLGSRIRSRKEALSGGMPFYKYISNRCLTLIENMVLGLNLSEYHTGFMAYHKKVLEILPIQGFSNDFVFDQEILISAVISGFRIGEVPVPVRYFPEASSINFRRSLKYGVSTLLTLFLYSLQSAGLKKSKMFENENNEYRQKGKYA